MRKKKKGQSTIEYLIIACLVAAGIIFTVQHLRRIEAEYQVRHNAEHTVHCCELAEGEEE